MNDTRLLLEEQTSRNALLEKKQRKFDSELGLVCDFVILSDVGILTICALACEFSNIGIVKELAIINP